MLKGAVSVRVVFVVNFDVLVDEYVVVVVVIVIVVGAVLVLSAA